MKKGFLIALALGVATSMAAEIYEYEPGPFDKVLVRADMDVVYRNVPDSAGFVRYEASKDFSDKIEVSCKKGKLVIVDKATEEDYGKLPTMYLYSDYLLSASYEGDGTMTLDLDMATPTLSVKLIGNGKILCENVRSTEFSANIVTGNGTIVAEGNCQKAKFTLTGTGVIQADRLNADEVRCNVLGSGTIGCRPSDTLNVKGIGTSRVYYYGNPDIKMMGGAKLEQMEEPAGSEPQNDSNASQEPREGVVKLPTLSEPSEEIDEDSDD